MDRLISVQNNRRLARLIFQSEYHLSNVLVPIDCYELLLGRNLPLALPRIKSEVIKSLAANVIHPPAARVGDIHPPAGRVGVIHPPAARVGDIHPPAARVGVIHPPAARVGAV